MHRPFNARFALAFVLLTLACSAQAANRTCSDADTLEALTDCISKQMPQDGSRGYVVPNETERADFRTVVTRMLGGECGFALPASLSGPMRLRTFDDDANSRSYCLLMEVVDANNDGFVDKGWGTFIVYSDATRELSHQAPHPKFNTDSKGDAGDSYTEREAIRIFKRTDARSYLMCGARRSAVPRDSRCQSSYEVADCAHNIDTMFHAANEALDAFYGQRNWTAIQWHGMAATTCRAETMFMSLGFDANPPAGSKILALRDAIRSERSDWVVNTPDTSCSLNATDNPTGRMLNGIPSAQACGTVAKTPSHKWMHIEQDVPVIGADLDGVAQSWVNAIVQSMTPPDSAPSLAATGASDSINLSWNAVPRATRYVVKRALQSGGPYSVLISNAQNTRHTDSAVAGGTTYYYVVLAANSVGESDASNEAFATPGSGGGTPVTRAAAADTYVRDGSNAGTNYGAAKEMQIKGGGSGGTRMAYLKFDLGSATSASRAILRLHAAQNTAGNPIALSARWVNDTSWSESALNWNNKPAMGDTIAGAATGGTTSFAWIELDVTAYVQAELARGARTLSIGLTSGTASSAWARIRSREAGSNRPELVITP